MGDTHDTQNLSTQQQGTIVEEDTVDSRLTSVTNRIKFVLELLGAHPDAQFSMTRQYLEAELIAWLNDLESTHDLYAHQQPVHRKPVGGSEAPKQTTATAATATTD